MNFSDEGNICIPHHGVHFLLKTMNNLVKYEQETQFIYCAGCALPWYFKEGLKKQRTFCRNIKHAEQSQLSSDNELCKNNL